MFIYLDPDVLAPCFGRSDERGAAAGKGVEDQGARGGCLYELLQQLDGLLVWVREVLVADLGTGDQVVRPFPGKLEASLCGEDDDLIARGERALEVSHAVGLFIPHDHRLDCQAGKPKGVREGLLHIPSCEAKYPPRASRLWRRRRSTI